MADQRYPPATRDDHEAFCSTEGWDLTRSATGKRTTHHVTYEFGLDDGRRLRTRISRPVDRTTYGASMWSHILREQLDVSAETFWACVRQGVSPSRGRPVPAPDALPAELVSLLLHTVKVPESEVREMTKDQAVARLNQFWAEGR